MEAQELNRVLNCDGIPQRLKPAPIFRRWRHR